MICHKRHALSNESFINPSNYLFLMKDYTELVEKVINKADIILMVLDARKARESINTEAEARIKRKNKKLIYVINKCDLVPKNEIERLNLPNSVRISALRHLGTTILLRKINEIARGKDVVVGVVGFPNTGKSTLINALKGRKSAPTSPISGFTKGLQKLRVSERIMMIDTPGVLPEKRVKGAILVAIGAVDADKLKDPEYGAVQLMKTLKGKIERHYGVEPKDDPYGTLEDIALEKKIIKKGGVADTERMAREIVRKWQRGEIR
ncbi:hypothetical protein COV19_04240 [Candidatus Woesearchaeota archaeon CG10_big_fil_rev_8_21_14_0_10_44_13]|nr:MAG: hypothetical protein COV19_04240 [Candidatus Woesearchaeota archaeon CG10_big_fil_rev_8_21_14_0_10_44_13]